MNILFPTDFSNNSGTAIKYARDLTQKLNGTITVVNIYETPVMESVSIGAMGEIGGPGARLQEKVSQDKKAEAEQKLQEFITREGLIDMKCRQLVINGSIKTELDKILAKENFDLVVLGTRGEGSQKGLFFGGIANHLIKTAKCPVLAIPENAAYNDIKEILYTIDLVHDEAEQLTWLVEFAKIFEAKIQLLHVQNNNSTADSGGRLKELVNSLAYDQVDYQIVESANYVSGEILRRCENGDANLIAMTTHTTGLFDKIFHSSLSTEILSKVNIPFIGFSGN